MKEYILLIPNNIKKDTIKKVRDKYFNYNIKFMSLDEFIDKYTFSYDNKTIYYLMKEYNLNYSTALVYLNNLKYISDKLDNEKMSKLKEIKKYLDDNNLLIYNKYFKNYVKDKEIYIYGYDYINKYQIDILNNFNYKIIDSDKEIGKIDKIYYAENIKDEVIFVCDKIYDLLRKGICINNIKLIISSEYKEIVGRIFSLYNIPICTKKNSIYSIYIVKKLLDNLNNYENIIEEINDIDIKNKVIKVLNEYSFTNDKEEVKELITQSFKNTYIDNDVQGIKLYNINDSFEDDDYVFLLGFNKENYPKVYKNNEYFSDIEREILGLDTSLEFNIKERESLINRILSIKNLTISYKLYDTSNSYTKNDLFDDIEISEINNSNYNNSNMLNKVLYAEKLDQLVKYNVKEDGIDLLASNYDIPYMKYDNKYKLIKKDNLYKYLDNKLVLAYTSFENYNKCKFKYYLSNILGINVIDNDFAIIIGNVCHYVLSCMDNNDFDTEKYYDDYLKKQRDFSKKELFFLNSIKKEMIFIVDSIRNSLNYSTFDKKMYEKKVYVNKEKNIKVTFMGVIDKVLYKEEDGYTYLVVIDYKTGNTSIKLDNMEYGIGMQLPIYLYLTSNMDFKNFKVVGFYLQKLLNNNLDNTKDYEEEKSNSLKLEGYSIDDENILSKFDTTYNNSKLIKSMKTTNNGFYKYSKVLSDEDMNDLISMTDKLIDDTSDNILKADFDINPKVINNVNVSCKYCMYKDICYYSENDIIYINKNNNKDGDYDETM